MQTVRIGLMQPVMSLRKQTKSMTIEEAQQLVEVWRLKQQQAGAVCSSSAKTCCETEKETQQSGIKDTSKIVSADKDAQLLQMGQQFWALLDEANARGVDLTAALTETLRHLNTDNQ